MHYAADLILTEVQRHPNGVLLTEAREAVGVGAEDFQVATEELLAEGMLKHAQSAGGTFLAFVPEEERRRPAMEPEAGGATPAHEDGIPRPAATAASASPAAAAQVPLSHPVTLLLAEAQRSGQEMAFNARVRFVERADGRREVLEVLEVYGVDLVKPGG